MKSAKSALAATSVFSVANVIVSACNALAAKVPCAEVAASVIPYPASVVGVPLITAHGIFPATPSTNSVELSANTLPVTSPSNAPTNDP